MGVTIPTTRFGVLEVPEDHVLTFPQGLIGFPDVHRYARVANPRGGPFEWLQALEVPSLAFVITDPRLFFPDYTVPVRPEDLKSIGMESVEDGAVVVILVVPGEPRRITANLQGPIVINGRSRLARQLVLEVPGYTTRHFIFPQAETRVPLPTEEEASC